MMAFSVKSHQIALLHRNPYSPSSSSSSSGCNVVVVCGLRRESRKPQLRSRVLSNETIQAVQSLKFAKSSPAKLEEVFHGKLARLLKFDLLDTLAELQRQSELHLALQVFAIVKKEVWYKPDLSLYCDMIRLLGKNRLVDMIEDLLVELKAEGLQPDTRTFTEIIGAYLHVHSLDKAMEMYGVMKESGCSPDKLTFTVLIRNLDKLGEHELASSVKKECADYMDYPEKFLEDLDAKMAKRRTIITLV